MSAPATYGSAASPPPLAPPRPAGRRPVRGRVLVVAAAALAMVLVGGTVAWALTRDTDNGNTGGGPGPVDTEAPTGAPDDTTDAPVDNESPPPPADEQCTDEIRSNERWVCLTSAVMDGEQLVIDYDVEWAGSVPDINGGFHLHVYGGDGTNPSDEVMGTHADNRGVWKIKDENPAILDAEEIAEVIGDGPKVCARIAQNEHQLVPDNNGGYTTGNCVPIQR